MFRLKSCFLLCSLFVGFGSFAQDYVPGEIIVKYKSHSDFNQIMDKAGSSNRARVIKSSWTGLSINHVQLKSDSAGEQPDIQKVIEELNKDPNVLYAEPNYILQISPIEVQEALSNSFYATEAPIQAPESWDFLTPGLAPVVVAVIDTGLDTDHADLQTLNKLWVNQAELNGTPGVDDDGNGYVDDLNGWNFRDSNSQVNDYSGHGTHVSGIVLSATQDIFSTSNTTNSPVQVMALKFMSLNGAGTTSDAIEAIYYAVENGADVINMSWGGGSYSVSLHESMAFAYSNGVSLVAAAGNTAENNDVMPLFPANFDAPSLISVGATTDLDVKASFSNYGDQTVDIGAPGSGIFSLLHEDRYGYSSGTSMAAPFVAALAALIKRERPALTGYQIKELIMNNDDNLGMSQYWVSAGRVNFEKAILATQALPSNIKAYQPDYEANYSTSGFRSPSSSEIASGVGCGQVADIYKNQNNRHQNQSSQSKIEKLFSKIILSFILGLPLVSILLFRKPTTSSGGIEKREHTRESIDLIGNIVCSNGMQLSTWVIDLSVGGAGLMLDRRSQKKVNVGDEITFKMNKDSSWISRKATVVRRQNKTLGIKFLG